MELRDRYIDPVSHQLISVEEIIAEYENKKLHDAKFTWYKFFLPSFLRLLYVFNTPKLKVLAYIFDCMNQKTNLLEKSYDAIKEETGVSTATIASLMVTLQEGDFIRSKNVSVWMINPALMYAGGSAKGKMLASVYNSLPLPITRKAVKKKMESLDSPFAANVANSLASKLSALLETPDEGDDFDDDGI